MRGRNSPPRRGSDRQARQRGQPRGHQRQRRPRQREVHERPVSAHQHARQRVASSGTMRPAQQAIAQRRRQRQRDQRGRRDHQRLGERQRAQQPAGLAAEREHRHERQRRDHQRRQDRRRERARGGDQRRAPPAAPVVAAAGRLEAPVAGLQRDEVGVDRHAERDGDPAQAHDRRRHAEQPHRRERQQHDERQRQQRDQRAAPVQQEQQHHQHHDRDLLGERAQSVCSTRSPARSDRRRRPAGRPGQVLALLLDDVLDLLEHRLHVRVALRDHDADDDRPRAVDVGHAARHRGGDAHLGDAAHARIDRACRRRIAPRRARASAPRGPARWSPPASSMAARVAATSRKGDARGARADRPWSRPAPLPLAAQRRHLGDAGDRDQRGPQHLVLEPPQPNIERRVPVGAALAHRHRLLRLRRQQRVLLAPTRCATPPDRPGRAPRGQPRPHLVDAARDLGAPGGERRRPTRRSRRRTPCPTSTGRAPPSRPARPRARGQHAGSPGPATSVAGCPIHSATTTTCGSERSGSTSRASARWPT